jgi:hypothetical protein
MMFSPPTELNQRTHRAASADFFNTIGQKLPFSADSLNDPLARRKPTSSRNGMA